MVSLDVEIIMMGITLMTPVYYGLYLLAKQDNVFEVNRTQISADLKSVSDKLDNVSQNLYNIMEKINSCQFCNKKNVDYIEYESDEWNFRSK